MIFFPNYKHDRKQEKIIQGCHHEQKHEVLKTVAEVPNTSFHVELKDGVFWTSSSKQPPYGIAPLQSRATENRKHVWACV